MTIADDEIPAGADLDPQRMPPGVRDLLDSPGRIDAEYSSVRDAGDHSSLFIQRDIFRAEPGQIDQVNFESTV